jgi:hypothetical protein
MKVRLVAPERGVCRLLPGEVKRLPRLGPPVGFYVSCPVCGRLIVVLADGQHVDESGGELRCLAPGFECESPMCAKHVHVKDGEFVVIDVHG